jgi:hypothetical protein
MVIAGPASPISTVIRTLAGNRGHPEPLNPPAAWVWPADFFCFVTIGNRPLTRWPRVWTSFKG